MSVLSCALLYICCGCKDESVKEMVECEHCHARFCEPCFELHYREEQCYECSNCGTHLSGHALETYGCRHWKCGRH